MRIIQIEMKSGNIYLSKAIELINDNKDMRFVDLMGDYVIVDTDSIDRIFINNRMSLQVGLAK